MFQTAAMSSTSYYHNRLHYHYITVTCRTQKECKLCAGLMSRLYLHNFASCILSDYALSKLQRQTSGKPEIITCYTLFFLLLKFRPGWSGVCSKSHLMDNQNQPKKQAQLNTKTQNLHSEKAPLKIIFLTSYCSKIQK